MLSGFTGSREETVFYLVLALASFFFIVAELVWAFRKKKGEGRGLTSPLWTLIPAIVLVLLCFVNRHPGKTPHGGEKVASYAVRKF